MDLNPTVITTVLPLAAASYILISLVKEKPWKELLILCSAIVLILIISVQYTLKKNEDLCKEESMLALNEICTDGNECDGGEDFIEVYNHGKKEARLNCYGLSNLVDKDDQRTESNIMQLPNIKIKPNKTFVLSSTDFNYKLSKKKKEHISLYKLFINRNLDTYFRKIDQINLDENKHAFRYPDGIGSWFVDEIVSSYDQDRIGTNNRKNNK
ncbi:hypothetical protein ACFL6N_02280 [Thermodesulfobacteriota bacterium]